MRVLYALVCEGAESRADGRVDAHGIFHQLYAPGFPARQDRLVLVVNLEWSEAEVGRNEFRIDLVAPDRSPALTISGHTDVAPRAMLEAPPQSRVVLPLENVVFPSEGAYEFELHAGGETIPLAPLYLIEDRAAEAGEATPL